MKTTRVYTQVYTFKVDISGNLVANVKKFFASGLSDLKNKTIRAITISNTGLTVPGSNGQIYLTFVDLNNNTLLYNYPGADLIDLTGGNASNPDRTRLRLFDLKGIELQNSYFFVADASIIGSSSFDINFYFED
jgi:hypothetical protein